MDWDKQPAIKLNLNRCLEAYIPPQLKVYLNMARKVSKRELVGM